MGEHSTKWVAHPHHASTLHGHAHMPIPHLRTRKTWRGKRCDGCGLPVSRECLRYILFEKAGSSDYSKCSEEAQKDEDTPLSLANVRLIEIEEGEKASVASIAAEYRVCPRRVLKMSEENDPGLKLTLTGLLLAGTMLTLPMRGKPRNRG